MKDYIIQNLDNAIENGYIKVYYQPVARTISGEICGVEALARWEDPEKGMIMPGDFIPVLEEAELIHKLDTEMIRLICRNYKKHRDLGHTILPASFNMSWLDFKKADMVAILENEVLECDMPRNLIRVEFTESALAEDHEFMLDVFRRLDDAGFKVWMDDFGSGYSSLNILKDVSFHTLKLDMEFLHDFSDRSKVIISSLIDMAKKVGVHTLAEGVETLEQYEFLARVGCEKVQGYYFGKPMPEGTLDDFAEARGFRMEDPAKRNYHRAISAINVLSATPIEDLIHEGDLSYDRGQVPLAVVEVNGDKLHFLFSNDAYAKELQRMGLSLHRMEQFMANSEDDLHTKMVSVANQARLSMGLEKMGFVWTDYYVESQIRYVGSWKDGFAVLLNLKNVAVTEDVKHRGDLMLTMKAVYGLYDMVSVLDFKHRTIRIVHSGGVVGANFETEEPMMGLTRKARTFIYPADLERYCEFVNPDTLRERMKSQKKNHMTTLFRTKMYNGNYEWSQHSIICYEEHGEKTYVFCMRKVDLASVENYEKYRMLEQRKEMEKDGFPSELLWDSFSDGIRIALFWKDRNRRYIGMNDYFSEYVGKKREEILGMTDDELDWPVDEEGPLSEENRILSFGEKIPFTVSKGFTGGKICDIMYSKIPVYEKGKLVGLMGCIINLSSDDGRPGIREILETKDQVSGLANVKGMIDAWEQFGKDYQQQAEDFLLLLVDIREFTYFNTHYSYDFGNEVLKAVGDELTVLAGNKGYAARIGGDRFGLLFKCTSERSMLQLTELVKDRITGVTEVEGEKISLNVDIGVARYSESENYDQLMKLASKRLMKKRAEEH